MAASLPTRESIDGNAAKGYAIKLSAILRNPDVWRNLPEGTPPQLRAMWEGTAPEAAVADAIGVAKATNINRLAGSYRFGILGRHKGVDVKIAGSLADATDKANADAQHWRDEYAILKAKYDVAVGLLKKAGLEGAKDCAPKLMQQAIDDFLSNDVLKRGTTAKPRKRAGMRANLEAFAEGLPDGQLVGDVNADHVIAFLAPLIKIPGAGKANKGNLEYVGKQARMLNRFLEHQTGGAYRKFKVKEWVKQNCDLKNARAKDIYWLGQADVDKLLPQVPGFWRDLAELQWAGGFRPEELPHLLASKVSLTGDDLRVDVCEIWDGERLVWEPIDSRVGKEAATAKNVLCAKFCALLFGLFGRGFRYARIIKTRDSGGPVHIPDSYKSLLKRMLTRGGFLLAPNNPVLHGGPSTRYTHDFEREKQFWRPNSFCKLYLAELRKAARAVVWTQTGLTRAHYAEAPENACC